MSAEPDAAEGAEGQVTIVVARRVKPGREQDYEAWLEGIRAAAQAYPGYLGTSVVRPAVATQHEYVSVFRFASVATLRRWEASEDRHRWMSRLSDLVESDVGVRKVEGVELWMTSDGTAPASPPSRFRMALLLIAVVYAFILVLSPLARWLMPDVWLELRLFVTLTVEIFLMTYVVMPRLTRWLRPWLYPGARTHGS